MGRGRFLIGALVLAAMAVWSAPAVAAPGNDYMGNAFPAAPFNDFSNDDGVLGTYHETTRDTAVSQPGETALHAGALFNSVWFGLDTSVIGTRAAFFEIDDPLVGGTLTLDVCDANFNSRIRVYRANGVSFDSASDLSAAPEVSYPQPAQFLGPALNSKRTMCGPGNSVGQVAAFRPAEGQNYAVAVGTAVQDPSNEGDFDLHAGSIEAGNAPTPAKKQKCKKGKKLKKVKGKKKCVKKKGKKKKGKK
jgi:hypothetical protein